MARLTASVSNKGTYILIQKWQMNIPIKTTMFRYFRQSLEILKVLPPLNTLRARELDVLAGFLYFDYKYRTVDIEARSKILFDYDTKLNIRELAIIDEQSFNNCLTSLRKKGIIKKRGIETNYGLTISPEGTASITFNFKINE